MVICGAVFSLIAFVALGFGVYRFDKETREISVALYILGCFPVRKRKGIYTDGCFALNEWLGEDSGQMFANLSIHGNEGEILGQFNGQKLSSAQKIVNRVKLFMCKVLRIKSRNS